VANSIFNGNNAAAGLTFSLLLATLTIGSVIGGKLTAKMTTARVVFLGGIILSAGFFLASFANANYSWLLWLTYGVMGGVGMGFTYSTTIACAQKWYPHKRGLITGVIVSAIGFGGVVFTPIIEKLILVFGGTGVGESKTFMVLSAVFLFVCSVGSIFMKNPPEGYMTNTTSVVANDLSGDYSPLEMLKTLRFYLVTATYLLACMGGLMMIGFAKPIAVARGLETTATIGVLAVSMFNSLGRLIWGIVSDKLGRMNTIIVLLVGNAALSLLVNSVDGYWIYFLIALIGFFYGGIIGTFPTLTSDLFGGKHLATNYGFVLLGFGIGAIISQQIAGHYRNIAANDISLMFPAFVIASCGAAAGILMLLVLRAMNKRAKSDNAV
jgi:OFA family oxalate/formate antiporter-like MFS transporter